MSTIKNEGKEKYIILRKKYINECPTDDSLNSLSQTDILLSPGSRSTFSEHNLSGTSSQSFFADLPAADLSLSSSGLVAPPFKDPPPYKPPPDVVVKQTSVVPFCVENNEQYKECVDEFKSAMEAFESRRVERHFSVDHIDDAVMPVVPPRKRSEPSGSGLVPPVVPPLPLSQMPVSESVTHTNNSSNNNDVNVRDTNRADENKENSSVSSSRNSTLEKQISVKEATQKFNQIACDEEAKVTSPPTKKKPEKVSFFFLCYFVENY